MQETDEGGPSQMADEQRTLEELDGQDWGAPESAPTPMVARCLALRRTPLSRLSPGDLRLLLGQQIGLEYLVPRALELVADQPLREADLHPGDLLSALLRVDKTFWAHHPTELHWLRSIANSVAQQYGLVVESCRNFLAWSQRH
jgi:contact-dependent growth inhibition (CDI) system CdiI-like immunity protein